jgi:hypothetical protein
MAVRRIRSIACKKVYSNRRTRRAWAKSVIQVMIHDAASMSLAESAFFHRRNKARAVYLTGEHWRRVNVRETRIREEMKAEVRADNASSLTKHATMVVANDNEARRMN